MTSSKSKSSAGNRLWNQAESKASTIYEISNVRRNQSNDLMNNSEEVSKKQEDASSLAQQTSRKFNPSEKYGTITRLSNKRMNEQTKIKSDSSSEHFEDRSPERGAMQSNYPHSVKNTRIKDEDNHHMTSPKQRIVMEDSNEGRSNYRHMHSSSCMSAKIVNGANQPSVVRFKQHQPHCIHHNQACPKHQSQQLQPQQRQPDPPDNTGRVDLTSSEAVNNAKRSVKYSKQADKYLLVEYRPAQGEFYPIGQHVTGNRFNYKQRQQPASENPNNNSKKTTIKFISQLYFLLHLSAMLSLLLHHKSLVNSERRQSSATDDLYTYANTNHHIRKHIVTDSLTNEDQFSPLNNQQAASTTTLPSVAILNQLPVPLMSSTTSNRPVIVKVNSVLNFNNNSGQLAKNGTQTSQTHRFGRQVLNGSPAPVNIAGNQDILVELIGYRHARCALKYFLSYLLTTSIIILICIRLSLMCQRKNQIKSKPSANKLAASYGFYYRTRLDCTPVLIGSISLGLIQLIVIGLDVANNIDWLTTNSNNSGATNNDGHRQNYLPFLQFAFVSLLMQYILGKVAKNQDYKESGGRAGKELSSERRRLQNLSINVGKGAALKNNGELLFNFSDRQATTSLPPALQQSTAPISNGLQNIALAHLLVTHILLWLMKLNSISLFHSVEQQQQSFLTSSSSTQPLGHKFYLPSNSTQQQVFKTQKTFLLDNLMAPESDNIATDKDDNNRHSRSEMESILRRKSVELNPEQKVLNRSQPAKDLSGSAILQQFVKSNNSSADVVKNSRPNLSIVKAQSSSLAEETTLSSLDIPVKNERGLRSAGNMQLKPKPTTTAPSTSTSAVVADAEVVLPSNSSTISLTHAQLMNLLNLASKSQHVSLSHEPPPALHINSTSPTPSGTFKSSLPRRMTAFKQANNSLKNSTLKTTTPPPKQRARVIITHPEPETNLNQQIDYGRENKRIKLDRPFPSMELAGRDKAAAAASQEIVSKAKVVATTEQPNNNIRKPSPNDNDDESEDDSDESDVDLDSLLPPVPNYNDTTTGDEDSSAIIGDPTTIVPSSLTEPTTTIRQPRVIKERKNSDFLKEEALAFNEAAATSLEVTTSPLNETSDEDNNISQAKQEALVVEPSAHNNFKYQPTFSDYLLPIVHQYHILIIAILFNMWLDSLRAKPENETYSKQSHYSNHKLMKMVASSASSGSEQINPRQNVHLDRLQRRWLATNRHHSMSSFHNQLTQTRTEPEGASYSSSNSTLSRYNSFRSSSSRQLLWIPSSDFKSRFGASPLFARNKWIAANTEPNYMMKRSPTDSTTTASNSIGAGSFKAHIYKTNARIQSNEIDDIVEQTHSVCSVFFGLLVVSASLIVILLSIELLSVLTQCITQLISILVCSLGLFFIWRHNVHESNKNYNIVRGKRGKKSELNNNIIFGKDEKTFRAFDVRKRREEQLVSSHRQFFHYLFLLAAYYCGISIALNLNKQYSYQQLFSQQVIQFCQRYLSQWTTSLLLPHNNTPFISNHQLLFLFHVLLTIKGFLLILQVTLQTVLIRLSCQRATKDLRQIYTFLMFANLSLWAMEICEQQQQHSQIIQLEVEASDRFKLLTLDSFTRFAASIVTLSHLYHGLVFMQH